jgi:hypothetical protein
VQQDRLAIHQAVVACQGHDHWTGEWLGWAVVSTSNNRKATSGNGEHKKQYAMASDQ